MSISSLGAGYGSAHSQLSQIFQQRRQDFRSMADAVQSGDMSAAQQALTALQQDQASIQSAGPPDSCGCGSYGALGDANNPLSADMTTLVQDVQSGDISAAQQALKQFETDRAQMMQNQGKPNDSGMSSIQQDIETLIKAIQDGNADGAKQDLSTLQNDLQTQRAAQSHHHHPHFDADGDSDNDIAEAAGSDQSAAANGNPVDRSRLLAAFAAYFSQNASQTTTSLAA